MASKPMGLSTPYQDTPNTVGATLESGEQQPVQGDCAGAGVGKTVWYRYQASSDDPVAVQTGGSGFDAVVGVWTGTGIGSLAEIACSDDDAHGSDAQVAFGPVPGTTYHIQVGGAGGHGGELRVSAAFVPQNDDRSEALEIGGLPGSGGLPTYGASLEAGEPVPTMGDCAGSEIGRTVWLRYEPVHDQVLEATTEQYDTVLAVWQEGPGGALAEVACNDDGSADRTSRVVFEASGGSAYLLQVGGRLGASGEPFETLRSVPNGGFDQRHVIDDLPFSDFRNTHGEATDTGEQQPSCVTGMGRTVWYAFTPDADMDLVAETDEAATNFDAFLAVWTGTALGGLAEVGCDEDERFGVSNRVPFRANGGTTYLVQVGGWQDDFGNVKLLLDGTAAPSQHELTVTVNGSGSGSVSDGNGFTCGSGVCEEDYDSGTEVTLTAAPGPGSAFTAWGGACSGNGACQVTMSEARDVEATFEPSGTSAGPPALQAKTLTLAGPKKVRKGKRATLVARISPCNARTQNDSIEIGGRSFPGGPACTAELKVKMKKTRTFTASSPGDGDSGPANAGPVKVKVKGRKKRR